MYTIVLASINAKWIHPSLALRLLKANLGELEERCGILEFALRQPPEEQLEAILAAQPRILGLSVSIWNHRATLELLKALEAASGANPDSSALPLVVLGGPEASFLPENAEIFRHADYVIQGEGERAFPVLCGGILAGKKPAEKFIHAEPVDITSPLFDPAYRLYTDEDLKHKLCYVESSRGCPFGCRFCLSPAESRGKVREFPLEPFLANMESLLRRGVKTFKFLDRSFNVNITRAVSIIEFFLTHTDEFSEIHFEMTPSLFPRELVEALSRFPPGKLRLEIGIQTLNSNTAAIINRAGNTEEGPACLRMLREKTGALIHADLIAALPGEDFSSFAAGFDRLWLALTAGSLPAAGFEIQPGILKLLPGSSLARVETQAGMRFRAEAPYEAVSTAALPEIELDAIKNFARFWELIINRKPFPDLAPLLFPPGKPVFYPFM
ncbi:MAG: B12-binding domain-containing radical SAM protein, partial [Treponema sp.]|nr:B12-binding domain-containing radical SAM protein [Treponema sp.]